MLLLGRFLLYNLLASLAAGLVAWGIVVAALHLMQSRSAFLHTSFLALPMLKSILILLGLGLIFPWPATWFRNLEQSAISARLVLPFVLAWFGFSLVTYYFLIQRERNRILQDGLPPNDEERARLTSALGYVLDAYQKSPCCRADEWVCCISDKLPQELLLLVSDHLLSPVALVRGGRPTVIFPRRLIPRLDEHELAFALAHELNHFTLRKPALRSSESVWMLMLTSPIAFLLSDYLDREEEKACDDLAVMILGQPEVYAGMLVKSYQYARGQGWNSRSRRLPLLPQLLGRKPFLSQRIERLLEPTRPGVAWVHLPMISYSVWALLIYIIFFARFAP